MFERFKKKKPVENTVFGEMKHWHRNWTASLKISIVLWNTTHQLLVSAVDDPEIHGINKLQEDSFARFQENLAENQNRIEEILSEYFHTADPDILISKFTPYEKAQGCQKTLVIGTPIRRTRNENVEESKLQYITKKL